MNVVTEIIYFGFELNLLEAHLQQHYDLIDRIIVVECENTTTGVPKPLLFKDNFRRFSRFSKVEHIVLPASTFPIQTKTFNEFKHQDANAKKLLQPYASMNSEWVFHNDTDEILEKYWATCLPRVLIDQPSDVQCVHHHLEQRSPYINARNGTFHVHRIYRAGPTMPYPKSVKRAPLLDTETNDGVNTVGWHFTNCFSTPEELYWKIKCRNWICEEKSMEFCREVFKRGFDKLDSEEFACLKDIFPKPVERAWSNSYPQLMKHSPDDFPLWRPE